MSCMTACKHCGCSEIDEDPSRGNKVCMGCGSVLEESAIVSEVSYVEGAGGSSSMVGQIVSGNGSVRFNNGIGGYAGQERESREVTLQKGRKRIQEVGALLKLNNHCRDTAFTFFKMAVSKGLTRGRPRNHVVAACLYTTCRLEGSPHLLLDFSDVLSVNVYELGKVFSYFCRVLYINVPPTDPCLYILRFANVLRFGEKEHQVASLALRIVTRMKRDWIVIGRRPAGICGAALIVAARYYNFNRTIKDMVKVVNIGEGVLRKRMQEFSVTPSASLTLDEFNSVDLEEEADPPAYREAKEKKRQELEKTADLLTSEFKTRYEEVERAIDEKIHSKRGPYAKERQKLIGNSVGVGLGTGSSELIDVEACEDVVVVDVADVVPPSSPFGKSSSSVVSEIQLNEFLTDEVMEIAGIRDTAEKLRAIANESSTNKSIAEKYQRFAPNLRNLGLGGPPSPVQYNDGSVSGTQQQQDDKPTIIDCSEPSTSSAGVGQPAEAANDETDQTDQKVGEDGELALDDISDSELEGYILNEPEVRMKTFLWMKQNGDFMRQMEEKRRLKAEEEEKARNDPNRKKVKKKRNREPIQGKTAAEAMEKVLQEKRLSNKINYSVLANLDPTTSTASQQHSDNKITKNESPEKCQQQQQQLKDSPTKTASDPDSSANPTANVPQMIPLKSRAKRKIMKPNIGGSAAKKFTVSKPS